MRGPETVPLDEELMTSESRRFAADLFARFPEFRRHAAMAQLQTPGAWTLVVTVPAPSGDPEAPLFVWVDEGNDPSVAFGRWHTHEDVWGPYTEAADKRAAFLDLIAGIMADRFVLCEDIGGIGDKSTTILDLSIKDALLDEVTSQYSPGHVRLRSWSGKLDREVRLDDLNRAILPSDQRKP